MTSTERIRSLLDERGVEWEACRVPTLRSELAATFWYDRDGNPCSAVEGTDDVPDGMLSVQANLTPEQAIEATLGRGECEAKVEVVEFSQMQEMHRFTCSECGESFGAEEHGGPFGLVLDKVKLPNYCPNCGRKVRV